MDFLSNINVIFYIIAYLVGAIPFGLISAKLLTNIDIRKHGSGSIGATNVLRVVKEKYPQKAKKVAIITLILDAFKGVAVILVAKYLNLPIETIWAIAFLAVLGHCFSPYLMFEGGKGVATGFGVMSVMLPLSAIVGIIVWAIFGKITKISSLSSLLGILSFLIFTLFYYDTIEGINTFAPVFLILFIITYKHIPNIIRLIGGKEKRVV